MIAMMDWRDSYGKTERDNNVQTELTAKLLDHCENVDKQIYINLNPDSPEARAVEEQNVAEDPIPGLSEQPVNEYVQKKT